MQSNTGNSSQVLEIYQENHTFIKIRAERYILKELSEYFSFYVSGYKFTPAYKNKMWDGKIRLFNLRTNQLYAGLLKNLLKFCQQNEYSVRLAANVELREKIDVEKIHKAIATFKLPFEPRDYQFEAVKYALENKRGIILSPTGSGKSLIIYLIARLFNLKSLIIVPTTSLVSQLYGDFKDYSVNDESWNVEEKCHQIYAGKDKFTEKKITISTWQSIHRMPKEYFDQFDAVFGDEVHLFKAKSLTSIMEKLDKCRIRIGTTGTIDERDSKAHPLTLTGLFGQIRKMITTKKLISKGQLSGFKIKIVALNHADEDKKNRKYQEEIDWIVTNEHRNHFIVDMVKRLKGNTLVLYNFVEKHGIPLYELMKENAKDHEVHFVSGDVGAEDREKIRHAIEKSNNNIIVGSFGTLSTGVNFRNLHNIVFTSPSKSMIRVMQSIGRGLRKTETKTDATLYDIIDDLATGSRNNYALDHGLERLKMYIQEGFDYEHKTIDFAKIKKLYKDFINKNENTLF